MIGNRKRQKVQKNNPNEMSVIGHFNELRKRLLYCIISIVIITLVSYIFSPQLFDFVVRPIVSLKYKLFFNSPVGLLMAYLKVGFGFGIIFSMPVILYQLWKFISPALKNEEKKIILPIFFITIICFFTGAIFAFFVIIPAGLQFLLGITNPYTEPLITIDKYISFIIILIIGMGLIFELPLLMLILAKVGIVTPSFLRKNRKYAILIIIIVSAIITPTVDPFNLTIFALPVILLYEISIWITYIVIKKEKRKLFYEEKNITG